MSTLKSRLRGRLLQLVRRFPQANRKLILRNRRRLSRGPGYPDWRHILAARSKPENDVPAHANRPRVLLATSLGAHLPAMQLETVLAAALQMRGADVEALLCDKILTGCQMCEPRLFPDHALFVEKGPQKDLCGICYDPGKNSYRALGIPVHAYSDTLSDSDRDEANRLATDIPLADIESYVCEGLRIGEHAKAGALRFFARATIDDEPLGEAVLRRYFKAALLTAASVSALFDRLRYDVVVFHHGIYVPQGIVGEVARARGIRVVNWNPAYRKDCFLFSHGDTYHHTLMSEPVSTWESISWSAEREARTMEYLHSRWSGENDWIKFHEDPVFASDKILSEIGLSRHLPIIGCLTNVMWDAQLHYPANAFANMLEWLIHTIEHFAERPDLQLVIRVHPAELRGAVPTRQPVVEELSKHFPALPSNVFLVGPESRISTYVLAELCDSVIIYGTKTGVELTSMAIPVIVAGEAWIRNKGISIDAASREAYDGILAALPLGARLPAATVERARKYAYHFFFRRMIPIPLFRQQSGWPPYSFAGNSIDDLAPGRVAGLDCICDGILRGTPFIYE